MTTTNGTNKKAHKDRNLSKEQDSNSEEKEIGEDHENERAEQPENLRNVIKMEISHIPQKAILLYVERVSRFFQSCSRY